MVPFIRLSTTRLKASMPKSASCHEETGCFGLNCNIQYGNNKDESVQNSCGENKVIIVTRASFLHNWETLRPLCYCLATALCQNSFLLNVF